jgi:hypothetical protein
VTLPWAFQGIDKFPGLWVNEAGHVLLIEAQPDSDILLVSFSPSKESYPIRRPCCDNKLSVRMPAKWDDDLDELVVKLAHPQKEPCLHLTPEVTGFYYEGPCLVPSTSMYATQYESENPPDLTWLNPLAPYHLVGEDKLDDEFELVKYIHVMKIFD